MQIAIKICLIKGNIMASISRAKKEIWNPYIR